MPDPDAAPPTEEEEEGNPAGGLLEAKESSGEEETVGKEDEVAVAGAELLRCAPPPGVVDLLRGIPTPRGVVDPLVDPVCVVGVIDGVAVTCTIHRFGKVSS